MEDRYVEVVIILAQRIEDEFRFSAEGRALSLKPEIRIIPYPGRYKSPFVHHLDAQGVFKVGSILLQSPYDPTNYARVNEAAEQFALEKHLAFSHLCGLLGAREVRTENIQTLNRLHLTNVAFKADLPSANSGRIDGEYNPATQFYRKLRLHDRFEGGMLDLMAAERFLVEKRLQGDPQMRALLRLIQSGAKLKERQVTVNLSEESKRRFSLVAALKLPAYANIDVEQRTALEDRLEYTLTYQIVF